MSDMTTNNEIDIDPMADGTVRCVLRGDIAKAITEKFAAYTQLKSQAEKFERWWKDAEKVMIENGQALSAEREASRKLVEASKALMEMNGAQYTNGDGRTNMETFRKLEMKLHALRLALESATTGLMNVVSDPSLSPGIAKLSSGKSEVVIKNIATPGHSPEGKVERCLACLEYRGLGIPCPIHKTIS